MQVMRIWRPSALVSDADSFQRAPTSVVEGADRAVQAGRQLTCDAFQPTQVERGKLSVSRGAKSSCVFLRRLYVEG